jgi:single-stranded DNA-binding protein
VATAALIVSLESAFAPAVRDGKEYLLANSVIPGEQPVKVRILAPAGASAAKLLQGKAAGDRVIISGPLRLEEDGSLPAVTALVACPATEEQFLNEVLFVGRVGGEPRDAESGKSTKRSIAVNRYRRKPDSDEAEELTDWMGTRAFGYTKDKLAKLKVGSLVEVTGMLVQLTNAKDEPFCEIKARSISVHKGRRGNSNPAKGTMAAGYSDSEFEGSPEDINPDW